MKERQSLPTGWSRATIQDLVGADGVFVDGDWIETKDQDQQGDVRLVQLADIGDGRYLNKSSRFLTSGAARRLRCTFLEPGDVLIARMPDPLGRACIFPGDPKPSVTAVDVCIVRTGTRGPDHRWLSTFINSPQFRARIAELQSGSTRKRISRGNLATLDLPLPPVSEQIRIVAAIEEQFTRLDAAVASLKRARVNLKRYRTSVLEAAVEGQLSAVSDPVLTCAAPATAAPISQSVSASKAFRLPSGWPCESLGALASVITSGSRAWSRYYGDGVAIFVMAQNVRPGRLDLTNQQRVNPPQDDPERMRTRVTKDDLLITIVGANTGDVCLVDRDLTEHYVCQSVALIRLQDPGLAPYVSLFLNADGFGRGQLLQFAYGAGRPHLNFEQLKSVLIPIPPAADRMRIVAQVESRLSAVEELEGAVEANLKRAERLREAILMRAFGGRLVPQDPTDEPASVMLERICAERTVNTHAQPRGQRNSVLAKRIPVQAAFPL